MIFQDIADVTGLSVYLTYTYHDKPTYTFKIFNPNTQPVKIKHNCKNISELESFMYTFKDKGFIFFARMNRYPVHIDPLMTNYSVCFEKGVRNSKRGVYPASRLGDCLKNAVIAECERLTLDFQLIKDLRYMMYKN